MVVSDYYSGGDTLEPETILRLSEQLLQAIAFLHEAGYAHGGMPVLLPDAHTLNPKQRDLRCLNIADF